MRKGVSPNPQQALDYFEAVEYYFQQGLTDGLPVVPPTPDRLSQFLDAANLGPNHVVGTVSVGAIPITAEKVALNAIMAGCLPEYMPVIVTGIEAMVDDEFSLNATAASTSGSSHMLVVSGKIVDELGINYGVNMLGPGARANATIGRTIRLILMNVCGTLPGVLDKSTLGNPGKYTSCIAEDESLTPWPPLRTDYGIAECRDAVTAFACYAPVQVSDHRSNSAEEVLTRIADAIVAYPYYARGCEIMVILVPEHLNHILRAGWSKKDVQQFLYQATQRSMDYWKSRPDSGKNEFREGIGLSGVTARPEDFLLVPAGGSAGGFSAFLVSWGSEVDYSRSATRPIGTP